MNDGGGGTPNELLIICLKVLEGSKTTVSRFLLTQNEVVLKFSLCLDKGCLRATWLFTYLLQWFQELKLGKQSC